MKRVIPVLLLSVFLVGCAAPAQTQLPIVTVTSTPTLPPTPTPTATETSTPTKDPNAPPEYSRFENGVYYLDKQTENGNTLTYMWNQKRLVYERLYFTAPVWDKEKVSNDLGAQDMFQLTVFIDKNIEGEAQLPTLIHHENVDPPNSQNFANFFRDVLLSKMADAGIVPNRNSIDLGPIRDGSHAFHFDFVNADGQQSWGIWEGTTITVHIRGDYDQLKAEMSTNGFSEAKSNNTYGPVNYYMVRIRTENGNLTLDIAPSLRPATAWTQKQIMEMFMFAPAAIMEQGPDLTHPSSSTLLSIFAVNQKAYPFFEIGLPP
jgi:hypothetical protein